MSSEAEQEAEQRRKLGAHFQEEAERGAKQAQFVDRLWDEYFTIPSDSRFEHKRLELLERIQAEMGK